MVGDDQRPNGSNATVGGVRFCRYESSDNENHHVRTTLEKVSQGSHDMIQIGQRFQLLVKFNRFQNSVDLTESELSYDQTAYAVLFIKPKIFVIILSFFR